MKANSKFRSLKKDKAGMMQVQAAVAAVIFLVVGLAVISLLTVFTSVLGGQTYELTEDQITSISNETIKGYVQDSIIGAFHAQSQMSGYLPIIALAVIIVIVISLVISGIAGQFMGGGGMGGYGGGYGGYDGYRGGVL